MRQPGGCLSILPALLLATLLLSPAPARADTLDTLLDILVKAGVVDSAVKDAKPLIACLIDKKDPAACVNVKSLAEQEGKKAVKKYTPQDPAIQATIAIIQAAYNSDWIKVLEISGTDLLVQIACKAGLSTGGPLKDFICGSVFKEISSLAKPVVRDVLIAVKSGDWWKLITLIGPQTGCKIIPGGEVRDALCGVLGQVLNEVGKFAKGGVKAGKDTLISFGETISGQTPHMHPTKYYELYWHPLIHKDVRSILNGGKPSHKIEFDHCVGYFDSHKASKSSAEKWCGQMRSQLAAHVNAIVPAIKAAPGAYFVATLKPQVPKLVIGNYHLTDNQKKLLAQKYWHLVKPFNQIQAACGAHISAMVPIPGKFPTHYDTSPPYTAHAWACEQAMNMLMPAFDAYRNQAIPPLLAKLSAAGCKTKALGESPKLYAVCDSWEGYAACKTTMTQTGVAKGEDHCGVDAATASPKLAKKVAAELGKRCQYVPNQSIACTRPWKIEQCKMLVKQYTGGVSVNWAYDIGCTPKNDPAYLAAVKQVKNMLDKLNGVQKAGGTVGPGGQVQGQVVVPPVQVCKHGFDPLAIGCPGNPKAPAAAGISLPPCPPDPNKDGADKPCYTGPYSADSGPATVKAGAPPIPAPSAPAEDKPPTRRLTPVAGIATTTRSQPDLVTMSPLNIGGRPATPGGTVLIDDDQAQHRDQGICTLAVQYRVQNAGAAPSPAYTTEWQGTARGHVLQRRPPLGAGGVAGFTDLLALRPGTTVLSLRLDGGNVVTESNERNNDLRLVIQLTGDCQAGRTAPTPAPPSPAGRRLNLPSR